MPDRHDGSSGPPSREFHESPTSTHPVPHSDRDEAVPAEVSGPVAGEPEGAETFQVEVPPVVEDLGAGGGPPNPGFRRMGYMRSSGLLISTTLVARFVGFLRDVVIADKFGASPLTDAYFVANLLPNFLNGVLQGGLSSVVVPAVSRDFAKGDARRAYRLLFGMSAVMGWAILALVLIVSLAAGPLVHIIAPGLGPHEVAVSIHLARILVWTVAFGAYAYLGAAALQAQERFVFMSLGPICMSGTATLVLLVVHHPPIVLLALGLLIGNALQFLLQTLPHLRWRVAFPKLREISVRDPDVRAMARRAWPALISSSVGQVNSIVARFFGSLLVAGSISEITYANRIVQVPLGVFGYAVSNASYPELARAYSDGRTDHVRKLMLRDMRMILLLSVPLTGLFLALAGPIVTAVYRHGHLTTSMASVIISAFLFYTGSLIPYSVRTVVNRSFFLAGETRALARISVTFVVTNALADWIFSRLLGAPGLALGTMVNQWLSIGATVFVIQRSLNLVPMRGSLDALVRAVIATVPLSLSAIVARSLAMHVMGPDAHSTLGRLTAVVIGAVVAIGVGAIGLWLVRYPALDEFASRFLRRVRRG